MRVLRNIKRIVNARIIYVCDSYIDFIVPEIGEERHGFAHINKEDYEEDRFDQLGGLLEEAVIWGKPLTLVIESRERYPDPKDTLKQRVDYLIDVQNT